MFGRRSETTVVKTDKIDTILGKEVDVRGTLNCKGMVQIEGKFEGNIECTQDLIISESGIVKADVKARHSIISGKYNGNIHLEGKLEIKSTGKVIGDIKVASLVVEDGGIFEGNCEMQQKDLKLVKKQEKKEA